MARFVLLLHECPNDLPRPSHCDLMLESGGALQTWTLGKLPRDCRGMGTDLLAAVNTVAAEQLADHRLAFLDYEGPVSGGRGSVRKLDAGNYVLREQSPDRWLVDVAGQWLVGEIELQRSLEEATHWQLSFHPSPPVTA